MDVSIHPSFEGKTMTFYIDGNVCEHYQCLPLLSLQKGRWFSTKQDIQDTGVDVSVVLVDGVGGGGGGGVPTMWWVGPGGTIGRFLPLEVSDK